MFSLKCLRFFKRLKIPRHILIHSEMWFHQQYKKKAIWSNLALSRLRRLLVRIYMCDGETWRLQRLNSSWRCGGIDHRLREAFLSTFVSKEVTFYPCLSLFVCLSVSRIMQNVLDRFAEQTRPRWRSEMDQRRTFHCLSSLYNSQSFVLHCNTSLSVRGIFHPGTFSYLPD